MRICPLTGKVRDRKVTLLTLRGHQMDITISKEAEIDISKLWEYIVDGWKKEKGLTLTLLNDIPVGVLCVQSYCENPKIRYLGD